MKSERRHELQYNELSHQITSLVAWAKRNGNYLAWGALLIAAVAAIGSVMWNSHRGKLVARENEYNMAMKNADPEVRLSSLTKISQEEGDKLITVEATLAVADEWANRVVSGQGKASAEQIAEYNKSAAACYQLVIDNFQKDFPAMATKAHIGLAKLAENRRDFVQAAAQYQQAKATCPQGNPLMIDIKAGTDNIETIRLAGAVQFATTAPAKPVTTAPASGPASKPALPATTPATKPAK
jgi:hypothetical protein